MSTVYQITVSVQEIEREGTVDYPVKNDTWPVVVIHEGNDLLSVKRYFCKVLDALV